MSNKYNGQWSEHGLCVPFSWHYHPQATLEKPIPLDLSKRFLEFFNHGQGKSLQKTGRQPNSPQWVISSICWPTSWIIPTASSVWYCQKWQGSGVEEWWTVVGLTLFQGPTFQRNSGWLLIWALNVWVISKLKAISVLSGFFPKILPEIHLWYLWAQALFVDIWLGEGEKQQPGSPLNQGTLKKTHFPLWGPAYHLQTPYTPFKTGFCYWSRNFIRL